MGCGPSKPTVETYIFVSNLHCPSCVRTIEDALSILTPSPYSIDVSIVLQSVRIRHNPELNQETIEFAIEAAGFDIESPTSQDSQVVIKQENFSQSISSFFHTKQSKHVAQCSFCQSGQAHTSATTPLPTPEKIAEVSESPDEEQGPAILSLSIGGMTCAACSSTLTHLLSEVDGVSDAVVNLMGHSARVVVKSQKLTPFVIETIGDAGFDAEVVKVESLAKASTKKATTRTISLKVSGMYCQHCPSKVMKALEHLRVTVAKPITSHTDPIVQISYTPEPSVFTIRTIISAIASANSPPFDVSVYHPPTLEEHAGRIRLRERQNLLRRFAFSFIVAIPTFIIGVVYMTLVSRHDHTRMYLMTPVWAGRVSRAEWALFIMSTPVMFYSTGTFHKKSIKEIRALWRKGSKTPVWKRFVRFGSMNLLVSAGVSVAYFASVVLLALAATQEPIMGDENPTNYFDTVVFLAMFLLAGRFLEAYSKSHTADAVSSLGKLRPTNALLVAPRSMSTIMKASTTDSSSDLEKGNPETDESFAKTGLSITEIDASVLEIGDTVFVRKGSSPPADGVVVSGETFFDESSLTGESKLIKKGPGDEVFLGTINQGRAIDIKIISLDGQSMLDKIVEVVREGQTRRAPIERVADLITGYFVPTITLLAIVTWVVWLSLGLSGALPESYLDIHLGGWTVWSLQFSIAVFVVACPCGIGLAAPTALLVGSGLAAKFGILVRGGGEAFQECAQVDIVVFDKTGTITEGGQPKVVGAEFSSVVLLQQKKLLNMALSIEMASSHPIALAIRQYCEEHGSKSEEVSDVEETPGRGLRAFFPSSSTKVIIGNVSWMTIHQTTIDPRLETFIDSRQSQGNSIAALAIKDEESTSYTVAMVFAVADAIRPEAKAVIAGLQADGIQTWMLSGDNEKTAKVVAEQVGIPTTNVIAGVLPHEKAQKIQWLQQVGTKKPRSSLSKIFGGGLNKRAIVAMTGDGINDAAALSAADIGIAIGSGSDVALSSASFILVSSNLKGILTLTKLSRKVFNRVKINFFWAAIYNIITIPIAAGVIYPIGNARLDPVWASLAMALSSVSVVCSSLLLKLYREPKV
ncbi:heavy metal translocatin [Thelephora ganbajun]|uniref:Heavy metal translocatin n=1 Tax=Thelephora ganbajun TaxID=370292 RepID=A0ACB6ZMW5_THEGA|nr:heavy metal translocatin [Thelephora ganbajun]